MHLRDSKSGEQVRPVGRAALAVLDTVPRREDSPWVFPGSGDGHFVGLPKVLDRVATRAGLADVSAHVLRHSFASVAAANTVAARIAGLLDPTPDGDVVRLRPQDTG